MNDSNTTTPDVTEQPTPFPDIVEDGALTPKRTNSKDGKEPPKDKKRDGAPPHKRSISGNLFSRLNLLRTSTNEKPDHDHDHVAHDPNRLSPGRGSAMAEAQAAQSKRRRKGSLRKTVLGKNRDRKNSELKKSPLSSPLPQSTQPQPSADDESTPRPSQDLTLSRQLSPDSPPALPSWPLSFRTLSRVSIPSIRSSIASLEPASSTASITSPTATNLPTDASTDDDDVSLSLPLPPLRHVPSTSTTTTNDSYFPTQPRFHPTNINRNRSPLATAPSSPPSSPPESTEWDYSETAFWGYVILFVTWLVFVVGMGSCFGVWSWAWDVGETPYAPPELEDDATLPIVGYYPALLVLTCVMAWVWVVVAWVGMKYFRHADLRGDDG